MIIIMQYCKKSIIFLFLFLVFYKCPIFSNELIDNKYINLKSSKLEHYYDESNDRINKEINELDELIKENNNHLATYLVLSVFPIFSYFGLSYWHPIGRVLFSEKKGYSYFSMIISVFSFLGGGITLPITAINYNPSKPSDNYTNSYLLTLIISSSILCFSAYITNILFSIFSAIRFYKDSIKDMKYQRDKKKLISNFTMDFSYDINENKFYISPVIIMKLNTSSI